MTKQLAERVLKGYLKDCGWAGDVCIVYLPDLNEHNERKGFAFKVNCDQTFFIYADDLSVQEL